MNSFYGGKQGASLIIVKHFNSYNEMVSEFKKGDAYTEVQYDEYVIIGKGDANYQGNIYRRGYEYTNNEGGAEFILNITGPAGGMAEINFVGYGDIPENEIPYNEEKPFETTVSIGAFTLEDMIPGGGGENEVVTSIPWKIRNTKSDTGRVSADIAMQIPYPVVDMEVIPVESDFGLDKAKEGVGPFYQKWTLRVPSGAIGSIIPSFVYTTEDSFNAIKDNMVNGSIAFKQRG